MEWGSLQAPFTQAKERIYISTQNTQGLNKTYSSLKPISLPARLIHSMSLQRSPLLLALHNLKRDTL